MRLVRRLIAALVIIIAVLLLFAPPLIGIGIEKFVDSGLFFGGMQNNKIEVTDYKKGWFGSDVTFRVKIGDPDLRQLIEMLGVSDADLPNPIELTMKGHIQHGPVFYLPVNHLPTVFGLAVITRQLIIPPTQRKLFSTIGIDESVVRADQTYLSFTGKFLNSFELVNFRLPTPGGAQINFALLQGDIWNWPFSQKMKGRASIFNFSISDSSTSILLPSAALQFDLQKDANGLWVGSQKISLPKIFVGDQGIELVDVNGIEFDSLINESSGLIEANKQFTIDKFQLDNSAIGPFHLEMSAHRLNAQAIADLINTYQYIKLHGEMYESQLQQKMLSLLPNVVTSGTSVQLNKFEITTPSGQLHMNGKLNWPAENFSTPDNVADLLDASRLQASLRIAVPVVDELIKFISQLTYPYQIPEEERQAIVDLRDTIRLTALETEDQILYLMNTNALSNQDGKALLKMVQKRVPMSDYFDQVKNLVLSKIITRDTSYLLDWQYSILSSQSKLMKQILEQYNDATNQQLHMELENLIKQGFIIKDKDDFIFSLTREEGVVKLNGHALK